MAGRVSRGTFFFSPSISITMAGTLLSFPVLIKYDAAGTAQSARGLSSTGGTPLGCEFNAVGADGSGNVLVAGYIQGDEGDNYAFSSGVEAESVTGSYAPLLYGVAAGPLGTVYGAGYASDEGSWNFGNGVALSTAEWCSHPLLVKFGE